MYVVTAGRREGISLSQSSPALHRVGHRRWITDDGRISDGD
ncbi:hypothetical protein [Natrinema sp. 74]